MTVQSKNMLLTANHQRAMHRRVLRVVIVAILLVVVVDNVHAAMRLWSWVTGGNGGSELEDQDGKMGEYRLPWRRWKNQASVDADTNDFRKNPPTAIITLFERVGTHDICKQRIADRVTTELQGRRVEELDNDEQRRLHTQLGLALTNCHLEEHDRKMYYTSAAEMTDDDFSLYTQFLLAVEDTLVSQLGHERWQRSVEILVSTLSAQLESTSAELYRVHKLAADSYRAQQAMRAAQNVSLAVQNATLAVQKMSLDLQNKTLAAQNMSFVVQNETLTAQHRMRDLIHNIARASELHFDNLIKRARAGEKQVAKVLSTTENVAAAAAASSKLQTRLLDIQQETKDVLTETSATSHDIANMVHSQHSLLLDVGRQSDELIATWRPALDALHAATSSKGTHFVHVGFFYLLWATALWLLGNNSSSNNNKNDNNNIGFWGGSVPWFALVLSTAADCYAPVERDTTEHIRLIACVASTLLRAVTTISSSISSNTHINITTLWSGRTPSSTKTVQVMTVQKQQQQQAFIDALLADIHRGNTPSIPVDECPTLQVLLSEAPPGYIYDDQDNLIAVDNDDDDDDDTGQE